MGFLQFSHKPLSGMDNRCILFSVLFILFSCLFKRKTSFIFFFVYFVFNMKNFLQVNIIIICNSNYIIEYVKKFLFYCSFYIFTIVSQIFPYIFSQFSKLFNQFQHKSPGIFLLFLFAPGIFCILKASLLNMFYKKLYLFQRHVFIFFSQVTPPYK